MGSRGPRGNVSNYRNPCLTMHQPWASLLVYGIKRIEGRSWPAPLRGRLWIHAAGKIPEPDTIKAMEDFYREIYALDGITDITFPEHYPTSRLLGCIDVVGCVTRDELACWDELPKGVRLEALTDFCWLCERPQKLIVPFEMRGFQGVYNLERKIYEAAIRGLSPMTPPLPVVFQLPDPSDSFSLKPGSIAPANARGGASSDLNSSASIAAVVAGAKAAATQFSKGNGKAFQPAARIEEAQQHVSSRTRTKLKQASEVGKNVPASGSSGVWIVKKHNTDECNTDIIY